MKKLMLVAIGGNTIITDNAHQSIKDQQSAVNKIARNIAELLDSQTQLIITHGNGPQVGLEQRRSEIAYRQEQIPELPLTDCVASTQGTIGYQLQQALSNILAKKGIRKKVISIVTQVIVDPTDKAFSTPDKPIGAFFSATKKQQLQQLNPSWCFVEDSGRGYRRVVASPAPLQIVELDVIKSLLDNDYLVISLGGGGIPVTNKNNQLESIDAVIDKDLSSSLLAKSLNADVFILTTGVDSVYINYRTATQQALHTVSRNTVMKYIDTGHFPAGSMLPKIQSAVDFIQHHGQKAIITSPEKLLSAIQGETGTHIIF
ncbi:carbamate kinase [Pasteurella testudinis]|uniref:carbamate kinase n=1 Tax=Pasteurella testudinis TaxID=761 RepID=UPI004058F499